MSSDNLANVSLIESNKVTSDHLEKKVSKKVRVPDLFPFQIAQRKCCHSDTALYPSLALKQSDYCVHF